MTTMNLDYEKHLEAETDRELKALPRLAAPSTLVLRVMAAVERRAKLPWFRCTWTAWPRALRSASLVALASSFGGVCFAGWKLSHLGSSLVTQRFGGLISVLTVLWEVSLVLLGAVARVAHQVGP